VHAKGDCQYCQYASVNVVMCRVLVLRVRVLIFCTLLLMLATCTVVHVRVALFFVLYNIHFCLNLTRVQTRSIKSRLCTKVPSKVLS
jgi:hypothetical protein